ncbi:hypothetical protein [Mesorhizobium sp.]|uniref:hypothetical protein n=1 Tax=Mesorhizobium sp. TaxID=1871066 RepID=UPI0025D3FA64|nr:hypothetical protein [Mesorhizobium sp.]
MSDAPDLLTDPPPLRRRRRMDALLDMLRDMGLTGGIFLVAEFSAPWCISARP